MKQRDLTATVLVAILVAGCGDAEPVTPSGAAEMLLTAMIDEDYARLCALSSDSLVQSFADRDGSCAEGWKTFVRENDLGGEDDPSRARYDELASDLEMPKVEVSLPGRGTFELQYEGTDESNVPLLSGFSYDAE